MRWMKLALFGAAALLVTGAAPHGNYTATVTQRPNGAHVLGNPAAKVNLTEFVSYTCSHCAHFNADSEAILRMTYIPKGKVSVAVHHLVRDPIDLTVAMLTNCGDDKMFFKKHSAFLASQEDWLGKVDGFSEAQRQRWSAGPMSARMKAIASDFGFYKTMERWGFDRTATDKCLSDQAVARRLVDLTEEASAMGVNSTPSFSIDGAVLTGTHDWRSLEPQIKARL
jgi:protein-disulfide isomerase